MAETLDDIKKWAELPDADWVAAHVPRFARVRTAYVEYEAFLKAVLKQACAKLAPLAVSEARAKGVASFAEKILRKRKLYVDPKDPLPPDPLARITDLCGGRVIAQTSDQVHAVCRFIEQAFDIDWQNSEDVSQRLRPTEFGYRSVHYIVLVNPGKLRDAGITAPIPDELLKPARLKAELQVRTLLEHAWADLGHEMTYKTELRIPDRIHREFATVAAVLENVDCEFGRLVHGLAEFRSNYGAYHKQEEVEAEIVRLRIVLSHDKANVDLAVKTAQLAVSIGKYEIALEVLNEKEYVDAQHQGVQRVRGIAWTEMYWDHPRSKEYIEGRRSLQAACEHRHKDAETLCALAESWVRDDETKARDLFHEAVAVDATEPVTLSRYLEFEIAHLTNNTVVRLAAPMIRNAIDRCRKQIEARANLPWAWASLAVLDLLIGKPCDAISAIAQVIHLCERPASAAAGLAGNCGSPSHPCAAGRALLRTNEALKRMQCIREKLPGFDWCQRTILLGLAVRMRDAEAVEALRELASWNRNKEKPHISPTESIVILSGGCAAQMQSSIDAFRPLLLSACEGLSFTLFSGGTTSGISGVAGDLAGQSGGRIRAFGYLPRLLPRGVQEDTNPARFVNLFSSPGSDFTPFDPLQGWTDIIAAGVDPCRVKLLSYAGGEISRAECIIALALGARVGVVENGALPKDRQFDNPDWQQCPNLVKLILDAMTLRAFLLVDEVPCKQDKFEKAAQRSHEEYVKSVMPKEPSLLPWDKLPEDLRISNFHQVAYAENILNTAGLGIQPITDPEKPLLKMEEVLGKDGVDRLAEMEHGRWNVERLLLGWHYAETKDVAKKLSPYLVPWDRLPKEIQKYDMDKVISLPAEFHEVGLEVYKL